MRSTYDPDLYDLSIPSDFGGDVDWYRRKARAYGGPILEIGAGTGRIAIPLATDGHSVHAIDANEAMLAKLRSKVALLPRDAQERIDSAIADMRSFRLERTFALAIIPFRAFLHNLTTDDQRACLACVFDHLRPGGRLAFNVFHPSLEVMSRYAGAFTGVWRWKGMHRTPDGGALVVSEANRYDTVRQMVQSLHRYEQYGSDGNLERTFLHDLQLVYLYPNDIRRLLEATGFTAIQIFGGFDERPFQHDTDELVIEASRP